MILHNQHPKLAAEVRLAVLISYQPLQIEFVITACFKGGYVHNDLIPRVQYVYNGPLTLLNCVPGKFHRIWDLFIFVFSVVR